jgi:hypothetical protein
MEPEVLKFLDDRQLDIFLIKNVWNQPNFSSCWCVAMEFRYARRHCGW